MDTLPFDKPGRFWRGNLHTHSTRSDGIYCAEEVCRRYREAGYDFLAITDHFTARYDWPITDTRPYRGDGFTTLIAAELHAPQTQIGERWHIKAVGLPLDFAPATEGETGPEVAARAHAAGAFVGIVHPSWYGLTAADADALPFAHAVEIYNHGSAVEVDRGNDWPYADALLNRGRRICGYASDDAHHLDHDWLGGWVYVHAGSLEPDALLDSLKAGRYYSSQGPRLHHVAMAGDEVTVRCSPARTLSLQGRGARSVFQRGDGLRAATLPLKRFRGGWFRVTVTDMNGAKAWSNPVWLDD
ncbi:MAG: phosphotransferase [Gammaproteobacteria bacterium]|nr:phosphotransferase [Gammaproteobacteria bacterium]